MKKSIRTRKDVKKMRDAMLSFGPPTPKYVKERFELE